MRVILHIGTEKTGSTSIQNFLYANRTALMNRGVTPACVLDPIFGRNNFALVLAVREHAGEGLIRFRKYPFEEHRRKVFNAIQRWKRSAKCSEVVVFSSEHMSSRLTTTESIEELRALIGSNAKVRVCCYLRPQDELLLGSHAEGIKAGKTNLQVNDPRRRGAEHAYGIGYFDYQLLLRRWENVFGRENLDVVPLYNPVMHGGDVLLDFVQRNFGLESLDGFQTIRRANRRLSGAALFTLASLNSVPSADPTANLSFVQRYDEAQSGGLIAPDSLKEFFQSFEQSNRAVALRYLGKETLFERERMNYEYHDPNDHDVGIQTLADFLAKAIQSS